MVTDEGIGDGTDHAHGAIAEPLIELVFEEDDDLDVPDFLK